MADKSADKQTTTHGKSSGHVKTRREELPLCLERAMALYPDRDIEATVEPLENGDYKLRWETV